MPATASAPGGVLPCRPGNTGAAASTRPRQDTDAAGWLRLTAAALAAASGDGQTGRYDYVRLHEWNSDMAASGGKPGRVSIRLQTTEAWYAGDGSATMITTTFPAGTADPGAAVPGAERDREDMPAGSWRDRFPGEPSSDPEALAAQLDRVQPAEVGVQARLRSLHDVARQYVLPCPVRAAALLVLARSPVIWRGQVTDRAGRSGVAVSVDSTDGVSRETLILDPVTGVLLAHDEVLLRNPGRLAGPFPMLFGATAYMETGRRDTLPPPT